MNKLCCLIGMFFTCGVCSGQNLIPNGSFEQHYSCPNNTGQVDTCIGWHKFGGIIGTPGTPDYFDSCASVFVGVPNNIFGTQIPFDGSAYMGLYTFDNFYWYREYIGVELIDTLIPGNDYSISMRVSRANWTNQTIACVASNKIGMRFTTFWYQFDSIIPINNYAQIYEDAIITDTLDWVLLKWDFIPDSSYTHVYIGNFFESDSTDTLQINCPIPPGRAYYFIDSVNIICTSFNCFTGVNEINNDEFLISPNPFSNTLNISSSSNSKSEIILYDIASRKLLQQSFVNSTSINTDKLAKGIYLYEMRNKNGVIKKGKVVKD